MTAPLFSPEDLAGISMLLRPARSEFERVYPGDPSDRQPVHSVYGGAHLFSAGTPAKLSRVALSILNTHAPDPGKLTEILGWALSEEQARSVHRRIIAKLEREAVEDYRIDFEDGYGPRSDAEEDGHAVQAARETAAALADGKLPPFFGIRIKPLTSELFSRSLRTLSLYLGELASGTRTVPANFVVTLPKVTLPEEVSALCQALSAMERRLGLAPLSLRMEIMVETPQAVLSKEGRSALPELVRASRGRCVSAHFGAYDYTAALNITSADQRLSHPACDFARHVMQVSLAGTGVRVSDGATTLMPTGSEAEVREAWKTSYEDIRRALSLGYFQGWDLHPGQLPIRYAAVYSFFEEGKAQAAARLKAFLERAAKATLSGNVFDDAATGQGLLNFFLRGISCGALDESDASRAGLTPEGLSSRSFLRILESKRE